MSGSAIRKGTVGVPTHRFFSVIPEKNNSRLVDAEVKILEDIAHRYANNRGVSGTIRLYSEFEFCKSCKSVIEQFEAMFPNIKIIPSSGPPFQL